MVIFLLSLGLTLSYTIICILQEEQYEKRQNNILKYEEIKYIKLKFIKKRLNKFINNKVNLLKWKKNIKKVNDIFYLKQWENKIDSVNEELRNYFIDKDKLEQNIVESNKEIFKKSLDKIKDKDNIIFWIYKNNLSTIKNKKLIIFDFNSLNLEIKSILTDMPKFINYLSYFCHKNQIILTVIGNEHPNIFFNLKIKYLNKNNYLSPYHYKSSMWDDVKKLPLKKNLSKKPAFVTVNKMINDILNQYGIKKDNCIYVGKEIIEDYNCYFLI